MIRRSITTITTLVSVKEQDQTRKQCRRGADIYYSCGRPPSYRTSTYLFWTSVWLSTLHCL